LNCTVDYHVILQGFGSLSDADKCSVLIDNTYVKSALLTVKIKKKKKKIAMCEIFKFLKDKQKI
jgi:hypothetical protein